VGHGDGLLVGGGGGAPSPPFVLPPCHGMLSSLHAIIVIVVACCCCRLSPSPLSSSSFCGSPARRRLPESAGAGWLETVGVGWVVVFMHLDQRGGATLMPLSASTCSALSDTLVCKIK